MTSQDVARYVGVSQPTVSRALRDDPKVSLATRERVREAARLLGYVPSATGRALAMGRSHRVGLLLTDVENAFYPHLIGPLHRALRGRGYELVLMPELEGSDAVVESVAANDLDGVLLATPTTDSSLPVRLRDRRIPFVYVNRVVPSVASDCVVADPSAGYADVAARLRALGHRRIGAVLGPRNTSTGLEREDVVRAALAEEGLVLDERAFHRGPYDVATGRVGMSRVLGLTERPTAVLCGNDVVAVGALNAARELGVRVPQDVSVVGFDDLPMASWPVLDMATVAFDLGAMATTAVGFLLDRLDDGAAAFRRESLPTRFVERGSVGPAAR